MDALFIFIATVLMAVLAYVAVALIRIELHIRKEVQQITEMRLESDATRTTNGWR